MKKPTRPKSIIDEAPSKFDFKERYILINKVTGELFLADVGEAPNVSTDEYHWFSFYGMNSSAMKQILELEKRDFSVASGSRINVSIPKDEDTIKREQAEYEEKLKEYNRKLTQYEIDKLKYDEYMLEKRKEKLLEKALLSNS